MYCFRRCVGWVGIRGQRRPQAWHVESWLREAWHSADGTADRTQPYHGTNVKNANKKEPFLVEPLLRACHREDASTRGLLGGKTMISHRLPCSNGSSRPITPRTIKDRYEEVVGCSPCAKGRDTNTSSIFCFTFHDLTIQTVESQIHATRHRELSITK